jgi:putative ABC transport system permease protein
MGVFTLARELFNEARIAIRAFRRQPTFFAAGVLTLALALSATIALISIADAVLMRPLPYPRPERLYSLSATMPDSTGRPTPFVLSPAEFVTLREQATSFEHVEAMTPTEMAMTMGTTPETIRVGSASAGFLQLFGLDPTVGRGYTEGEDRARAPVIVLDGGLWQRRFGSDPGIVGQSITLDGVSYQVVGVTRAGYRPLLQSVDAWVPLGARIDPARMGRNMLGAARLRSGVSAAQAIEETRALQAGVQRQFPESHGKASLNVVDMHTALYGPYRPALLLALTGAAFLLLIACTNVANLAIGRVSQRRGEIAVRLALGASRGRIVQQHLIEAGLVCISAGVLASLLLVVALPMFLALNPDALPADVRLSLGPRVILLLTAVAFGTTLSAGLLPAWHASGTPALAVAGSSLRQAGIGERRTRRWLLAAQVAFAVLLISAAAVVSSTLFRLARTDPGFVAEGVLTMQLAPPVRYPTAEGRAAFVERVLDRVEQLPGVTRAGTTQTTWRPLASMQARIQLENGPPDLNDNLYTHFRHVTPGYFDVLPVRVLEGRPFDKRDRMGAAPVAVVSRSFADRMWPGRTPLRQRLRRTSPNAPWLTVVGVVDDVMDSGLGLPLGPTLYVPYLQQNTNTARVTLVVRVQGNPESHIASVRDAIWSVDPLQPIDQPQSITGVLNASIAQPRFRTFVLSAFGACGLVLACGGAYGIATFAAVRRRREIGIRVALGADPSSVVRLVVQDAMIPAAIGGAAGALLAVLAARVLTSVLAHGESLDLSMAALCAGILLICAAAASWLPARRSAYGAPVDALRMG